MQEDAWLKEQITILNSLCTNLNKNNQKSKKGRKKYLANGKEALSRCSPRPYKNERYSWYIDIEKDGFRLLNQIAFYVHGKHLAKVNNTLVHLFLFCQMKDRLEPKDIDQMQKLQTVVKV